MSMPVRVVCREGVAEKSRDFERGERHASPQRHRPFGVARRDACFEGLFKPVEDRFHSPVMDRLNQDVPGEAIPAAKLELDGVDESDSIGLR